MQDHISQECSWMYTLHFGQKKRKGETKCTLCKVVCQILEKYNINQMTNVTLTRCLTLSSPYSLVVVEREKVD
jgi:hypothetical protein